MLEKLDNDALLLLYLADEVSAEDKAAIDAQLAADAALAQQLEAVRDSHAAIQSAMRDSDAGTALPIARDVAVRRVGRAIQQWHVDRRRPLTLEEPSRPFRMPWWSYLAAGVAAVVAGILVWSSNIDDSHNLNPEDQAKIEIQNARESEQLARDIARSLDEPVQELALNQQDEYVWPIESQDNVSNAIFLRDEEQR